ncbi:MAG: HDOD domain-containing protein [Rubrivivax sp.]|nr:HDOD domain-containing protein [Rubrivivax sp.]
MSPASRPDPAAAAPRAAAVRMFGRFQLLRLLGKSERTMAWMVADPRTGQDLMLVLPREQPAGSDALEHWKQGLRKAARLNHPNLAPVIESGVQDGWPFAAYDADDSATLRERLGSKGLPGAESAALLIQALQGTAFAHEAGAAHGDLQTYMLLVNDQGVARLAGLEVAAEVNGPAGGSGVEPVALRAQRDAAERDVLMLGLVLHQALCGKPPIDEADLGRVVQAMTPLGRELVRLPWDTPQPIPEALRAIVNRATDRQERQRYRNARTLQRALEGWLQTESAAGGGPLALLQDRLRSAGVLPSSPGAAQRAARLALMDRQRTFELAEVVLQDIALAFEMLRAVNSAQVRNAQAVGSGPVLTVRRAIAMLGLDGVRRAALTLRPWPGPLAEPAALALERLVQRVKRAGEVALALRPAGYDAEVVYLITLLQSLGRLVVQYHFADEAAQIQRLMQPAPAPRAGEPDEPGMSEEGASFAVIGADTEAIGAAVARHLGFDDSVLAMIRRLPLATPVRASDGDDDLLRLVGSCANEVIDSQALPAAQAQAALQRVVQRYGRPLGLSLRDLQAALHPQATPQFTGTVAAELDPLPPKAAAAGGLRQRAERPVA